MDVDSGITIKYENISNQNFIDNSDCISAITKDKDGENRSNTESKDSKSKYEHLMIINNSFINYG